MNNKTIIGLIAIYVSVALGAFALGINYAQKDNIERIYVITGDECAMRMMEG